MQTLSRTFFGIFSFVFLAEPIQAQVVSGRILNDESGAPVRGAIVSAFSGRDTTAATLSLADGSFRLQTGGRRGLTLLVRAVGLQPARIALPASQDTVVQVRMVRIAFRLEAVRVNEFTSCAKAETGTADIVDVWTEVTKALENTRIDRESKRRTFDYILYERVTDTQTGRMTTLRNDSSSWRATRPFRVAAPSDLASNGYVINEPVRPGQYRRNDQSLLYRAPDEMVLLDASFQRTHCFWASNGDGVNMGMIGVYFMPISGIRINDIRGVFWIDAKTYELKRLDYVYTQTAPPPPPRNARGNATAAQDSTATSFRGVSPNIDSPEPGGILVFSRLEDGTFIIVDWAIFLNDTWTRQEVRGEPLKAPRMLHETGGRVVGVSGG